MNDDNGPDWAWDFTINVLARHPSNHPKDKISDQLVTQGQTVGESCRGLKVSQPSYNPWRQL